MAQLARRPPARRPAPARRPQGDRDRHRARRRQRLGDARRDGLPGRLLLLPGLGAARALDRRPGRHQRDQGLRQRGRLRPAPVRRHDEGRRLPRPRGERLAARRDVDQHHRPGRRPGRAVQPRVRRPAGDALVRRRARRADVLLPRPDRPAAAARRLLGAPAPGRRGPGPGSQPPRDARRRPRRRRGPRGDRPQPRHRGDRAPRRRRRRARERRLLQRLLPLDERDGLQRHRRLARAPPRRRVREPVLHPDPPDVDPAVGRVPVEADADERVAAKRRPRLGAARRRTSRATRPRSPRPSATTSSRSATRGSATSSPATSPRARRRSSATTASASARPGAPSTSTSATRSSSAAPT